MKTIFKLYILVIIVSSSIYADPNSIGLEHNELDGSKNKIELTFYAEGCHIAFLNLEDLNQLDNISNQKTVCNNFTVPESFCAVKTKFSSQFILPQTRTDQRFIKRLRI